MRVLILGSAAGGGFPQWNCNCDNCCRLRAGSFTGKSRTQTQVAVSADGEKWALLNASPDLRVQIESAKALHPKHPGRDSPIKDVVITSADIDQIAGLLSLRELQPFQIHCMPSISRVIREGNSVFGMLNRVPQQVTWQDIRRGEEFELDASPPISCTAFSIGSRYPVYVRADIAAKLRPADALIGLMLKSSNGATVAYLPAVPALDEPLMTQLAKTDLMLFDGTFWSDDELIRVQGSGATAREMGHIPISGAQGSLARLAGLKRPRKIFLHVNNTNPILDETSAPHKEVRAAGWEVAEDGWEFEL